MSIKQKLFFFFKPNLVKVVVFLLLGIFWWWMIDNSFFIDLDMPPGQQSYMKMTGYEFLDRVVDVTTLLLFIPALLIYFYFDYELSWPIVGGLVSYIYMRGRRVFPTNVSQNLIP